MPRYLLEIQNGRLRRPVARRFVIPVATTGLWTLWAALLYLMMPFGMWEEEAKSLVSPDGRYKAVLSYRDGLTFGYQHVLLERTALHGLLAPAEVTEADNAPS